MRFYEEFFQQFASLIAHHFNSLRITSLIAHRFAHCSNPIISAICIAHRRGSWFDVTDSVEWDDRGIRVGKRRDGDGRGLLPVGTREREEGEGGKDEGECG
jgi:hypothetical protein